MQELVFPCENQGLSREEIENRLAWVMELFGLASLSQRTISSLSGGQQQRLALAVATMQGTDVLVLDEPTANLDQEGIVIVEDILKTVKAKARPLLLPSIDCLISVNWQIAIYIFKMGKW